ncbi:MAG: Do family serine endopeptidase [Helicobacteraceae bacterium]|jgi:serine protease Do|nr:Do family serine endopeptidase [Helicobacteraceae bacterium]
MRFQAVILAALFAAIFSFSTALLADKIEFQDFKSAVAREQPTGEKIASYSKMLKEARQNVVNISTQKSVKNQQFQHPLFNDPFFREFFDNRGFSVPKERVERSLGSGVIISADGYIVTNNHVIEGASKVLVTLADSKEEYEAKIIGSDPKSDLAVIKIEAKKLRPAVFFDSDNVEVGDQVFAIGNPFGVGETITSGIVSAINRQSVGIVEYEDFIQTDAAINPGNSGGALVNSTGALVGINSAILTRSGASHGVGFSIPSNMVKRIAKQLVESGAVSRAWLGVGIADLKDDQQEFYARKEGALVMSVEPKSPAEKAGLKRGDLVVKIDGKAIDGANSLRNVIGGYAPNAKVAIEIVRDKKSRVVNAVLGSQEKAAESAAKSDYQGLSVSELNDETRSQLRIAKDTRGVVVREVKSDSAAESAGFNEGDVVVQIEESEIASITDFKKAVSGKGKKRFYILRRGIIFMVAL